MRIDFNAISDGARKLVHLPNFGETRSLFAPGFRNSLILFLVAFVAAVLTYVAVNLAIVSLAESRLGSSQIEAYLADDNPEDLTARDIRWDEDSRSLATAWDLFDGPRTMATGESLDLCPTEGKPLVKLLGRLECVERQLGGDFNVAALGAEPRCAFADFAAGRPQHATEAWPTTDVRQTLVSNVLGVGQLGFWPPGVRPYTENVALGANLQIDERPARTNGTFERGLIYWFHFDAYSPDALLLDPQCREMRAVLDGFSEKVSEALRDAQGRVSVERWILRAINGPIQFVMLTLSIWAGLRLWARSRNEEKLKNDQAFWDTEVIGYRGVREAESSLIAALKNSNQSIERWLLELIPMLGFLGTVIGMISAMELVGDVVSAAPGSELNAAMGNITSALSVAFYTTFIGIVAASILGLFQERRNASEIATIRSQIRSVIARRPENFRPAGEDRAEEAQE